MDPPSPYPYPGSFGGPPPPRAPRNGGLGAGWWGAIALGVLLCVSFVGIFAVGFFYMRGRGAAALPRAEELSAQRAGEETTSSAGDRGVPPSLPSVTRHVPRHPLAVLAG